MKIFLIQIGLIIPLMLDPFVRAKRGGRGCKPIKTTSWRVFLPKKLIFFSSNCNFLGADVILKQLQEGPKIRRVGMFTQGPPARSHSELVSSSGENIGEVTSGGFSPCLKKNIAMDYVKSGMHRAGTEFKVVIRGMSYDAVVTKMPFVPTKYYKPS